MRRAVLASSLVLAAALAVVGCGSDDSTGTGGTGGSTGSGGSGATGSGGSSGGTSSGACQLPKCFNDLNCTQPSGACMIQQGAQGTNICYANGVKFLTSIGGAPPNITATTRYVNMGGSICFVAETPINAATAGGGTIMTTYKDGSGRTIGTATINSMTGEVTYACASGGASVTLGRNCQGMGATGMMTTGAGGSGGATSMCTMGTCS